jgi:hypothetical protein
MPKFLFYDNRCLQKFTDKKIYTMQPCPFYYDVTDFILYHFGFDGSGSVSCPKVSFGICGVEFSYSVTGELVCNWEERT